MDLKRRSFLTVLGPAIAAVAGGSIIDLFAVQAGSQSRLPSRRQEPPPEPTTKIDPRRILKANQKDIKENVDRLVRLAEELKKEVDKTDSAEMLSLSLVRKAEEIEKLARHIKNLARG